MAWQDEVAQQRSKKLAEEQAATLHEQSIGAVKDSGSDIISALLSTQEGPKDVRVLNNGNLASKDDMDTIIRQLKELHLTNLLEANKPNQAPVLYSDLGDKIEQLITKFETSFKQLDTSDNDAEEIKQLQALNTALKEFMAAYRADSTADTKADKALLAAVKAINIKPVVNVPVPKITVPEAKVDLSPLQAILERYFSEEESEGKVELDDFRAQDIDNTNPDMQYVGFVAPNGNWYIIENDVKGNRMRYIFGSSGYEEAFTKASMYTYSLLNEAIHALTA
jgi:hypothetical protein